MNITTKTGLIASPRKRIVRPKKEFDPAILAPCAITRQVPLALRPFGGLYNPYSKGCSVLCNHPAAQEVKNVVRLAKDAWITEAKVANLHGHGGPAGAATAAMMDRTGAALVDADGKALPGDSTELPDHVPEEFFRRYTDTDSRPLTPTPTVASGRTRASVGGSHLARRCVTPEPQTANGQERKQLILDLRRSHSQETLYWNASSELSPSQLHDGGGGGGGGGGVGGLALGYGGTGERGTGPTGPGGGGVGAGGGPAAQSAVADDTGRTAGIGGAEDMKLRGESDTEPGSGRAPPQPMTCINAMDDGEEDPPRRRGKRRKKSKQLTQTISFVPNQDPETQIAKIDPDSPNYSARPSLVPTGKNLLCLAQDLTPPAGFGAGANQDGVGQPAEEDCFLDDESLGLLRRGLNIDIVEMIFERYKGRAIREAFRTATMDRLNFQTEAVRTLQRSAKQLSDVDYEKWIDLPRKYSRSSARFELPIDTRKLTRMTPIEYLHDYVVLSDDRKQLYHRIFARNLPREEPKASGVLESIDSDSLPETETGPIEVDSTRNLLADVTRYIPMNCFDKALHEALGFHGTPERIAAIRELLELNYDPFHELQIDFRTWCGIVAFSERFINTLDRELDPCDEVLQGIDCFWSVVIIIVYCFSFSSIFSWKWLISSRWRDEFGGLDHRKASVKSCKSSNTNNTSGALGWISDASCVYTIV
ncbi:uncharacterized protein LOC128299498 [Anopheles moucheti]|uniref:uncharacterized protein LOC128299498 n=1 Tax=Anopheles moucheti TaxID=186751 RepID=UPI0022F0C2FC|nr:uncharacterized protein LOC128299498 [Anopheles moucheti]